MFASAFLLETVLNFKLILPAVFSDAFKYVMNCYQLLPSKYLYSVICFNNYNASCDGVCNIIVLKKFYLCKLRLLNNPMPRFNRYAFLNTVL